MEQLKLFEVSPDYRSHKKYRNKLFKTKNEIEADLRADGKDRIYHVLSFGGGTQSAHLLEQHFRGEINYDFIIFSDTGAEPQFIHDQVRWWRSRQQEIENATPFITTHHSSMERGLEEMLMRYIHTDYQRFQMPVYCSRIDEETGEIIPAGIMPRQCTVDFKIVPVKQMARRMVMNKLGLEYRQKMPDDIAFIIDIGFSYDEIKRIQRYESPQFKYMYLAYPLVEENMTTQDSIDFLIANGLPTRRSRCYLCPFNCDDHTIGMDWDEIIRTEPISFLKACWFDEQLRKVQRSGSKIMRSIPYLHYSRQPLMEVYREGYERIAGRYRSDLDVWVTEWETAIHQKYAMIQSYETG
ncbi:hypothetical protein K0T92_14385 [Paenibacillus oenotherae]|uniref:Phosphoadenosine phosphosulphate reductase domain-containing protein n=1 Tax=Paenibacillus oenotherae TaxID=1435645 RepID=A0ABS7D7S2_9BACL|nr:hypothetical protein [Paenibacillus oenotherae]MBW7475930.1 hypothetical protein [Paenibacillus oenotherae]